MKCDPSRKFLQKPYVEKSVWIEAHKGMKQGTWQERDWVVHDTRETTDISGNTLLLF